MASSNDEEIKAAVALSLAEDTEAPKISSILGLDRKAMEAERLARQAARKRERSISPPGTHRSSKAPKMSDGPSRPPEFNGIEKTIVERPSGTKLNFLSASVDQSQRNGKPAEANAAIQRMANTVQTPSTHSTTPSLQPALAYPRGVVKKTWAFGHERDGSDIKIEEVLESQSLKTAVLSAFQWNVEWVLSKLKTPLEGGRTKCVFIMQGKEAKDREQWQKEAKSMGGFLRLCFPPMGGLIFCMHSKLMLLFHEHKLRIAVPTANLLNFDWGETGQMENSVFIIDLPRKLTTTAPDDLTPFGKELTYFMEKQGLDQNVRDGVLKFDFSATSNMAFIHTIGGIHYRDDARTGLISLSRAVNDLNLNTDRLEIDFAASSIGQLSHKQLRDLHSAAKGEDLLAQAKEVKSKAGADFFKKKTSDQGQKDSVGDSIRIYFPTEETVRKSTAGSAGTICLQRSYFEGKNFPRSCFRDYKSTRTGLLSHNKILCARGSKNGKKIAFAYVGSANMSKSAWGELPASGDRRISCRNWECGVLLPVVFDEDDAERLSHSHGVKVKKGRDKNGDSETESEGESKRRTPGTGKRTGKKGRDENGDSETDSGGEAGEPEAAGVRVPASISMAVFDNVLSLPFKVPGDAYDGREPWYFKEQGF